MWDQEWRFLHLWSSFSHKKDLMVIINIATIRQCNVTCSFLMRAYVWWILPLPGTNYIFAYNTVCIYIKIIIPYTMHSGRSLFKDNCFFILQHPHKHSCNYCSICRTLMAKETKKDKKKCKNRLFGRFFIWKGSLGTAWVRSVLKC